MLQSQCSYTVKKQKTNLQFQYDAAPEINALYGIDLEIRKGECVILTGESGCGKTTLTRCLNGLIPNFFEGTLTGEILYEGVPVNKLEQYELSRKIGTVFQDPRSQFFAVNTTDEVAFGCENLAFSTERINQNVDAAFSRMNIDVLRDRSLFGLSSGEKQRLAVASIYAMDTDVIVLDEPTANLDGETIQNLRELLFTLKAEGKTLIISEHRLSWLVGIADRYVYILDRFGLAEYSERHPLSLSGGQKQRVTIAASIAAKSDILVLDEPTSGLDGRNMLRLKNILRELKKQGMLIFIVTHDAEFLEGLTDELLTISNKEENMDKREKQQSPLRGILQFASQRKGLLRISVILSVLSSAFGMVPYAAVAVLLGKALDNALTIEWAVSLTLVALAGYFLKHFLYSKSTLCSHKAAYEIIQNIRCAIMRKMSKMSMGTIQEKSSGEFKQLVIDDTERLEGQIAHAIPEMTASILIPIFVFAYLLFVDWRMALASLASAVLGNVIYYSMMIGRSERMKEYMSANGDMNATIVEYVNGMEVIRMFNQTASSMGRFKGAVLKVRDITTAWYKHCYPFMSISQVVMPSTIAFVLPVGVVLLSGGTTTLNEVILCILLSMGLVGSLQAMIEFWHDIAAIYEIQPRIQALLEAKELPEPIEAQHSSGNDVELKDVHFSYGAIEVIHGVSFTAKAGTVTALVGPSGSGKSTLAKLIARFWDVSAGAVTVGGADIRNLPLSELSEKISYVSQDNFLFNMSLRDNIRIGKPDATDTEVERAASLARCDDFIARFPKGYDTNAGDAGARLSGGERQRLAIARAILKDAPIIILDEATAFTDPENEDKLQQSIDHLTKGKTLIVIAHRLSTIMYADKILLLEDGSISAAGTHEQLLSSSQTYLDMWKAHISAMDWSMNKEVEILC